MSLAPEMDEECTKYFNEQIKNSNCYLEYGCGGSTVYANNIGNLKAIYSVDTSLQWISKIGENIIKNDTILTIDHIDLGDVGPWGYPVTSDEYKKFWRYPVTPWEKASINGDKPDLILIDDRFRVACFLYSLLAARIDATIIFDDYFDRPPYFEVEKFCQIQSKVGRAAIFKVVKNFETEKLVSVYSKYISECA